MAVTKSRAAERAPVARAGRSLSRRGIETVWLLAVTIILTAGVILVHRAKSHELPEAEKALAAGRLLNLNAFEAREQALPAAAVFPSAAERAFAARKIYGVAGEADNVGTLARIRVPESEIRRTRGLVTLQRRLADAREREEARREQERARLWPWQKLPPEHELSLTLLTREQFRQIKPLLVVRRPNDFTQALILWSLAAGAAFWLVHLWWRARGFQGDRVILPAVMLLTGLGLILMVSLRDPLRDTLIFADFAQGVAAGCVLLAAMSTLDYRRIFGGLSFVPLLASFVLSALLIAGGSGPGTSDVKVNLFGFQPVEIIRLLLVLFLAGYFARRWEVLRAVRESREPFARFNMPPLEYVLPVFLSVLLALLFFFLQKDLGPALVFIGLFLALYAIARNGALVAAAGLGLMLGGFLVGYIIGVPHTVSERVAMWLSPWNNAAHGGDQLAQSLWGMSTGGLFGTGAGLGDPEVIPAGHTDLILSVLGEQLGFAGLFAVFALYTVLIWRALRIALRAAGDYEFFLAAGLALVTAMQVLLIAGGVLGVLPLSGVVTPFLSYGRSALLANFAVFAILLAISARPGDPEHNEPFRLPMRAAGVAMGALAAVILVKAAWVQVARDRQFMVSGALVTQADGMRRYQYNPRFQDVMREIPKGSIYDRQGLPLATSSYDELEKHRAEYQQLGIALDRCCPRSDARYYPFGRLMFDLLGDLRTRARWGASNTSFVERDLSTRLRGYDERPSLVEVRNPRTHKPVRVLKYDYRELIPLLRHRWEPDHPSVRRVLDRPRDVKMSVDARFQVEVARIMQNQLKQLGKSKGAAVVLNPVTGDLLASVSLPMPSTTSAEDDPANNPFLDRARYGLYPPGSTFKMVTAIAALRANPQFASQTYECIRLPDGRVGNYMRGSSRPIRDDVQDKTPHGRVNLERGLVVSCNAYFAQLGTYNVGAKALFDTAALLGIVVAAPNTPEQLRKSLPQSSYGQGQVVASPFQLARVAATVANGGMMPFGRWVIDESNLRTSDPQPVLSAELAGQIGRYMREVVTQGTGRRMAGGSIPIAGKTGTAELADAPSHAWFAGFAPYGFSGRRPRGVRSPHRERPVWRNRRRASGRRNRGCGAEAWADTSMKLLADVEKKIERGFRRWTEQLFGAAPTGDLLVAHRAMLEEIERRIQPGYRGKRIFPFNRVTVQVRAEWEAALAQDRRFEQDVRELLAATRCEIPAGFVVEVECGEAEPFAIECRNEAPQPKVQAVGAGRLVLADGTAIELNRPRTNIGRMRELVDGQQRILRRNGVVIEEGEAGATVSRSHAHISFNAGTGQYRLCDDGSEYGTSIFRDGVRVDVPAANRRGERLKAGDEIYFGRAAARFELG